MILAVGTTTKATKDGGNTLELEGTKLLVYNLPDNLIRSHDRGLDVWKEDGCGQELSKACVL